MLSMCATTELHHSLNLFFEQLGCSIQTFPVVLIPLLSLGAKGTLNPVILWFTIL
jgi:hypothetical protein